MSIAEQIVEKYPIRKSKQQKEDFRRWAIEACAVMGWEAREEKRGGNVNVLIGDVESAQVLVTAHYDTPPGMPVPNFVTPANVPVFLTYQVGMVLVMLLIAFGAGALVGWLTKSREAGEWVARIVLVGLCGWLMFGPANPNNVNDNTSGVAAVLEAASRIPAEERGGVAMVLFDNEEKGMLGSGAFARAHKRLKRDAFVLNMDCVGDGAHVLIVAGKKVRALPDWQHLTGAFQRQVGRELVLVQGEKAIYPSDQANFRYGVAFCACKRAKAVGYYCDKIHTKHDITCEQVNLDFIAGGVADFVHSRKGGAA